MTEKEIKGRQLLELTEKFFEHSDNVIFVQQISGMNEVMIKGDTRKTLNMAFTLCETLIKKTGIKIDDFCEILKEGITLESDNKVFIDIDNSEGGNHAS